MNLPSIAVSMTEMWCSVQRWLPISSRSWNINLRVWRHERVWGQIVWSDLTFWSRESDALFDNVRYWAPRQGAHFAISVRDILNVFQAAGLAVVHRNLWHHRHGHHVVLSYHPEKFLAGWYQGKSGSVSMHHQRRDKQSCGRCFWKYYPTNAPRLVTVDMKAHLFVCATSRYTYGSTGHVAKKYLDDSYSLWLIMISHCSVYGD